MSKENKIYAVLPLRNTVLFPNQIIPIYIGRKQSLKLISDIANIEDKTIVVVAQKDANKENPKPTDLYEHAVLAKVMKIFDMPDNSKSAIVKGLERVKISKYIDYADYYKCEYESLEDIIDRSNVETIALAGNIKALFANLIEVASYLSEEQSNVLNNLKT